MKKKLFHPLALLVLTILVTSGSGVVGLLGMERCFPLVGTIGLQAASANSQYGILGGMAPELELDTWIDGNGNRMAPIRLENYIGKVVYLYFFQDW